MRFAAVMLMAAVVAAPGGCGGDEDCHARLLWRPDTACGGWDLCGGADAVAWLEDSGW